ncbi:MAG: choice-of-anchor O protein [Pseudomonadota bacterium]
MSGRLKSRIGMTLAASGIVAASAYAMVGDQISKILSNTIELDTTWTEPAVAEHTFVKYLRYYVPAQTASGETTIVEYKDADGNLVKTRDVAKPVFSAFLYGPAYVPDGSGGYVGHGRRDVYAALSLDDGNTWKQYNLSESATKSSLDVATTLKDPADGTTDITAFPGDAVNVAMGVAGNKVVVAWPSRYCSTGNPAYALEQSDSAARDALATYLGIDIAKDLYLTDAFGVNGSQGSHDYSADGLPQVGEVPYNCLWSARGVMVEGDDPRTDGVAEQNHVVWFKPERLTSGARDVNRVEIDMVKDAGTVIVWQEDPDGLRPGSGDGPGEGWSGATAGSKTDIWYSFLPYEHFETVNNDGTAEDLLTYWAANTEKPQSYVPFAVPMRLTNNDTCSGANPSPYCTADATLFGLKNQCETTITLTKGNKNNNTTEVCVSADGLPGLGNTAAVRPRVSLRPKLDATGNTIGAWVVVINEEDKGLGNFAVNTSDPATIVDCDPDASQDDECVKFDEGKNIWYHSFDMGRPQTSADASNPTSLVANLVSQGNMINQPEVDWRTGDTLPAMSTANLWNFSSGNFDIYRTEIARRGSLLVQAPQNVGEGNSKLMAFLLFKQGLINQGGPADIMARRIVDSGTSDNPYDFSNLVCDSKLYADGSNPYYPKGVCMDPAINLSSVTPQTCEVSGDSDGTCPTIDSSGIASTDPEDNTVLDKMTTWIQCPGSPQCGTNDLSTALGSNLDDQSWYNPLDLAKGHRGYIWGDMVVVMYAWSPNWKLNATGHDRYELYIRRSFDGGKTWTTTPATWGGVGTNTCETMRDGATSAEQSIVCTDYAAGAEEQARNVSQLKSREEETPTNKYTILDPRYSPDPPTMPTIEGDGTDPDSDVFNPSRFFVVFEAGDNTTVSLGGEPEPLDIWYGRAVNFGDQYQVDSEESALMASSTWNNEFARLTTGSGVAAEEASLAMSPAGDTLYAVWAQEAPVSGHTAEFARVWYSDANFTTSTPPISDSVDSNTDSDTDGGGGCSAANSQRPFDPTLPLLVALALIGLGMRRSRNS